MNIVKIDSISAIEAFSVNSDNLRTTDPCYDMETWCAGTIERVKHGKWDAHVGYHKDSFDMEGIKKRRADLVADVDRHEGTPLESYYASELRRHDTSVAGYIGRVAYLHIVHSEDNAHFDHESELDSTWVDSGIDVGVDSGQAGFFDEAIFKAVCDAREAKDSFYETVCNLTLDDKSFGVTDFGAVSSTGWGDGSYTCMVRRNDHGQAIEALIIYLAEYDEEEDNEEDSSEAVEG